MPWSRPGWSCGSASWSCRENTSAVAMQEGPMKKQLIHSLGNSTGMGMLGSEGTFAHAYKLGNFVYMTGQTGFTLDGKLVGPYDPAAQARQACENIKALMEKAGGTI